MMIELDGMSHSGFDVEDIERCEKFYTEVLGAKVEWKRTRKGSDKPTSMKLYVGDLGLSIGVVSREEKIEVPRAVHWAYRADHEHVLEYIEHVKACGVEVDGPVGHGNEPQNVSWFFADPDGHKLEIEAHYPTAAEALAVVEQKQTERKPDLDLYHGGQALEELRARQAEGAKSS
jgi:catechol 2,3-dioxygenase-like lactoylglutathione lyase family enzyme